MALLGNHLYFDNYYKGQNKINVMAELEAND